MRLVIILVFVLGISTALKAQEYEQYLGLRGSFSHGLSYKVFKNEVKAMEALLSYREGGFQLTALIETYKPMYMKKSDRFYKFTGVGAHVGYTSWYKSKGSYFPLFRHTYSGRRFSPVIGLDVIAGIEYRCRKAPWVFGISAKPFFDLFGKNYFNIHLFDIQFSIHYKIK